jgi:hypothetical protein
MLRKRDKTEDEKFLVYFKVLTVNKSGGKETPLILCTEILLTKHNGIVKASQRWLEFEHHKSARYDEGTSRFFA